MERKTFNIRFFLKKKESLEMTHQQIVMRITVNGEPKTISTHRGIEPKKWDQKLNKSRGKSKEDRELNDYLQEQKMRAFRIKSQLEDKKLPVTAQAIRNGLLGISEDDKGLLEAFAEHNKKVEELEGKDYKPNTVRRYKAAATVTGDFVKAKFSENDIPLRTVNHKFITDYEHYLKTKRKLAHNSAMKYLVHLKTITSLAMKSEWITRDPFINYKIRMQRVDREYLTEVELEMLRKKDFKNERLERVKDIFVFCCYTGLAYADVKRLSSDHLQHSIEGSKQIILKIKRQKTAVPCRIPLLPFAIEILNKYQDDPICLHRGVLLPTLVNQKMNAYLKEIADLCGINKKLTTHLARHTFATTVTLANGIPVWIVQKMLGHANISSTQVYARVLDPSIDEAMSKIAHLYNTEPSGNSKIKRLTGTNDPTLSSPDTD